MFTNFKSCTFSAVKQVEILEGNDITIINVEIKSDYEVGAARFQIHCKMDEYFWTWMQGYHHERREHRDFDEEVVPFLDGDVFALYDPEDK